MCCIVVSYEIRLFFLELLDLAAVSESHELFCNKINKSQRGIVLVYNIHGKVF